MDVMSHANPHLISGLESWGISNAVVSMISATVVCFLFLMIFRPKGLPVGLGNLVEVFIDFIRKDIVEEIMGAKGRVWMPFVATMFFFVLFNNLSGLIPIPGNFTPTSSPVVTGTLACIVFLAVQSVGIIKHGPIGYFVGLVPHGVPKMLAVLMLPLELIGLIAKPFSLAVRLYANMFAGHAVILIFLGFAVTMTSQFSGMTFLAPVPLLGVVVMLVFEVFVSFIQAYIFATLTAVYLGAAIEGAH